ncbi:MAG: SurA N-terminal domain-containing protein [Pseudomonadota bacterium]
MLQQLRSGASSIVAKILLGMLVVSFGLWGIGDIFRNVGSNSLATVGTTEISTEKFRANYDRERQYLARRTGQAITNEQAESMGLRQRVLSQMLTETAFDEQASQLGLQISRDLIAREVSQDPTFTGSTGNFDSRRFEQLLASGGYNKPLYFAERTQVTKRRMMAEVLTGEIRMPSIYEQVIHRLENETRSADYIILSADKFAPVKAPPEDVLQKYYDTVKATYNTIETRELKQLVLTAENFARQATVTDEEAKPIYEAQLSKYGTPEKRQIEQLSFKDKASADTFAAAIKTGNAQDLITKTGAVYNDLGIATRGDIIDTQVGDTAFTLPLNTYSNVIESQFGPVILRAIKIEPAKIKSFDDVKAAIKQELALQRGKDTMLEMHDKVEDERASGASLGEIAGKLKLTIETTPPVDRQGKDASGKKVESVNSAVLEEAFQTETGVDNEPVQLPNQTWIWYEVVKINPEKERQLSEIADKVLAQWMDDQQRGVLTQKSKDILAQIEKGKKLAAVATELGVQVKTAQAFKRDKASGDFSTAAADAAFRIGINEPGTALTTDNKGRIIFVVTKSDVPGKVQVDAALTKNVTQGLRDDVLLQFITGVQQNVGMTVNQDMVEKIAGSTSQ